MNVRHPSEKKTNDFSLFTQNRFYLAFIARKRVRIRVRDLRDGNRCSVPGGG